MVTMMKSGDISATVFKRSGKSDIGNFSIDSKMLSVLMALDGQKSLRVVSRELNLDIDALIEIAKKLVDLKLIEEAKATVSKLGKDFFTFLNAQLSLAIGPLSSILIEDAVHDLGHNVTNFPSHRAAELVDLISREIQREDKRNLFKQKMLIKIKELQ